MPAQVPSGGCVDRTVRRLSAAAAAAALLGAMAIVTSTPSTATRAITASATVRTAALSPAWLTYHLDNTRSGNDTTESAAAGVVDAWTATVAGGGNALDGSVYATPLIYGNSVYVATENNTIYAFSTATGAEQWHVNMNSPKDATLLPCGNISPVVGVTGTPVIDPNADSGNGVLYMVGMTSEPHYRLYGTDLVTHAVVVNSIVDARDINVQGQRGALAVANGVVYIPFGGRAGDCSDFDGTPYYGIIEGASESTGGILSTFIPGSTTMSGIWDPGGESVDGAGNVYVSTGNGSGPGTESVFKLTPGLVQTAQWRPSNADTLDGGDTDVGSIVPALIGGGDVFQGGKSGLGSVLGSSLANLTPDPGIAVCGGVTVDAMFGSTAYAAPYIYIPCANGLHAFTQTSSGNYLSPAWTALSTFVGPPIVSGGLVWTLAGGNLYGFNPTNGSQVTSISVGSFSRFESPVSGGGQIYVAGDNYLKAFRMVSGCASATVSAVPTTSQVAGLSVNFSATATGPNCGAPQFEYWIQYPNGVWHLKRTFSATAAFSWDTTGLAPGSYTVHLWANQTGDQTSTYEALATLSYSLTGCTSAGLGASPGPPQPQGTPVLLTASSTGCPTPVYEFWLQYPSGTWVLKQAFSTMTTWSWDTTGYPGGAYTVHVWANEQGADLSTWQALGSTGYSLAVPPGCSSASVAPPSTSAPAGSMVGFTASSSGCPNPQYEFWVQLLDGSWVMKRAFSATATWSWDTSGLMPGVYTVHAWANQQGHQTANLEAVGSSTVTLTGCTSAGLAPPSTSAPAGSTVNFTASSGGCPNPQYEFWVQMLDGSWVLKRAFSATATWGWDTTGLSPGTYTVHVWANQTGAYTGALEVIGSSTVTLTGCTSAGLAPPSTSAPAGSTVNFTASSGGCPNPQYEFWVQMLDGSWVMKRAFSATATWGWDTTGLMPGTYTVHVWANQTGAYTGALEVVGSSTVTLTGCTSAMVSPSSGSAAVGTTLNFNASSSGCPNPQYEFWLQYPDGSWHMMQAFGVGSTWQWNTTGFARGTYTIHAWANQTGAYTGAFEVFGAGTFTLT